MSLEEKGAGPLADTVNIAVVKVPKISNFTDFDSLSREGDATLYYVSHHDELSGADASSCRGARTRRKTYGSLKNTAGISACGFIEQGKPVVGICGGYQMMGDAVVDPDGSESDLGCVEGLHILQGTTTFSPEKLTFQVTAECRSLPFLGESIDAGRLRATKSTWDGPTLMAAMPIPLS